MNPNSPQFKDALPPINSDRLDGHATSVITRQEDRLIEQIGRIDRAHIPGEGRTPLYGYSFEVHNDTGGASSIDLTIETNPRTGEPIDPEDRGFVDARNRVAILRSRERSRGSRLLNYAFRKNRGDGPGGHGYDIEQAEADYHTHLYDFIARKVDDHQGLDNIETVTEAVSKSVIQEQRQMSALENMAAEQKSGNRFLNFFRNHKKLRFAAGVALTGIAAVGVATGQLEVAIPALAARTALSATGGYVLGRTGWDALQNRRARRLDEEDPRMAGDRNGDFSGELEGEAAFQRLIKLHGAEARAGSHSQGRQRLIGELGGGSVQEYYATRLDFDDGLSRGHIRNQVRELYEAGTNGIRGLQEERLMSDQTQSRRRHVAGLAGGIAIAALPAARLAGFIDVGHVNIGGGSGSHSHIANMRSPGTNAPKLTGTAYGLAAYHGSMADNAVHGGAQHSMLHPHETFRGISTNELRVKPGGGFISTLQDQYHLSAAQADATYDAMYGSLHNAPGTYMYGTDIRIAAPGNFKLPGGARAILEQHLKAWHRMPDDLHSSHEGTGLNVERMTDKTKLKHLGKSAKNVLGGTLPNYAEPSSMGMIPSTDTPQGQALRAIVQHSHVPETDLHGLTTQELTTARADLAELVKQSKFSELSPKAQNAIEIYTKASIDSPGPKQAAHEAANKISELLTTTHGNFNSMSPDQLEELQRELTVINAN